MVIPHVVKPEVLSKRASIPLVPSIKMYGSAPSRMAIKKIKVKKEIDNCRVIVSGALIRLRNVPMSSKIIDIAAKKMAASCSL